MQAFSEMEDHLRKNARYSGMNMIVMYSGTSLLVVYDIAIHKFGKS